MKNLLAKVLIKPTAMVVFLGVNEIA